MKEMTNKELNKYVREITERKFNPVLCINSLMDVATYNDMKAVELCQSYRLSGIIYNLRHTYGLNIQDRWKENENTGARYKEYFLVNDEV